MKPYKTLIVEDDSSVLKELKSYICTYTSPPIRIANIATGCSEALDVLIDNIFDVSILDIDLPDGLCFDIVQKVPRHKFGEIVFFTRFGGEHIEELIKCRPIAYLPKPLSKAKLQEVILQIESFLSKKGNTEEYIEAFRNHLGTRVLIKKDDIMYVVHDKRNFIYYRILNEQYPEKDGKKYLYLDAIAGEVLHAELDKLGKNFVQCSRNCLLNLSFFNEYDLLKEKVLAKMPNGETIEISKGFKDKVYNRKGIA